MADTVSPLPRRYRRALARAAKLMFEAASFDARPLPDWLSLELSGCAEEMDKLRRSPHPAPPLPRRQARAMSSASRLMAEAAAWGPRPLEVGLRLRLLRCAEEMARLRRPPPPGRKPTS